VPNVPDGRSHLFCEEIVAGLLEENEKGEAGLRQRAAAELREEAGFTVSPAAIELLGAPFFVAPGIISEKIFLAAVDVTGLTNSLAEGDGTPMEEGGVLHWRTLASIEAALADGTIQDAKTELALRRFLAKESLRSGASSSSSASSSVVISSSTSVSV
jgi:ADP-ribose pyrophosphatase